MTTIEKKKIRILRKMVFDFIAQLRDKNSGCSDAFLDGETMNLRDAFYEVLK